MANLIVGVDVPQAPSNSTRRRGDLFQGRHRHMIKRMLHYLESVQRADAKSQAAGDFGGYEGAALIQSRGSTTDRALKHLIARSKEALAEKA